MERETIRVLLVDDDQGDFEYTRAMLAQIQRPKITLDWVASFEEGRDALQADDYDVYIVDYFLEDRTGLDLLREAGRRQVQSPVIMFTGRGSPDVDIEAMRAGAADYLVKGQIDPEALERSIRYALDRFESQLALRMSEERHRGMFDHLPIGLFRSTADGGFLDANPALVRILGYPDPGTLAQVYASTFYVNSADTKRFRSELDRHGVVRGFETQIQCLDGRQLRLRNTARLHRSPDGHVEYVEGSVEDVSFTSKHSGHHREAAGFEAIFEHGGTEMLILDLEGVIQNANPAFYRSTGYSKDDLVGKAYTEIWTDQDRSGASDDRAALADGRKDRTEAERRLLDHQNASLRAKILSILIRDADQEPDHILVMFEHMSQG